MAGFDARRPRTHSMPPFIDEYPNYLRVGGGGGCRSGVREGKASAGDRSLFGIYFEEMRHSVFSCVFFLVFSLGRIRKEEKKSAILCKTRSRLSDLMKKKSITRYRLYKY